MNESRGLVASMAAVAARRRAGLPGVRAEQQTLENIAAPLTAEDTPAEGSGGSKTPGTRA